MRIECEIDYTTLENDNGFDVAGVSLAVREEFLRRGREMTYDIQKQRWITAAPERSTVAIPRKEIATAKKTVVFKTFRALPRIQPNLR